MRDVLSTESNKRQDQSTHEARGFFFRFERNRIAVIPQCIQSRCTRNRRGRDHNGPSIYPPLFLPLSLSPFFSPLFFSLSLSLSCIHSLLPLFALTPRNEIMVIDYPTWKPPSGISITYVCIPTGNLPLIRSNSVVTQFTPASNLKQDCLMAQGTIEMGFSDFAGPRSPFGTIAKNLGTLPALPREQNVIRSFSFLCRDQRDKPKNLDSCRCVASIVRSTSL